MNVEEELRVALTRHEPPDGFADRVLARVERRPQRTWFRPLLAMAAALVLVAGLLTWQWQQERERRIAAEKAKADLLYALEVTESQLQHTRTKLQKHSVLGGLI